LWTLHVIAGRANVKVSEMGVNFTTPLSRPAHLTVGCNGGAPTVVSSIGICPDF
jgi:hypothetical protein